MAYYAVLDANNIVVAVISGADPGTGQGKHNQAYWESFYGALMTDYAGVYRKHYAGLGYMYLQNLDAFIPPSPYPSWVIDANTCEWIAPVAYPADTNKLWGWDETTKSWIEVPPKF